MEYQRMLIGISGLNKDKYNKVNNLFKIKRFIVCVTMSLFAIYDCVAMYIITFIGNDRNID